MPKTKEQLADDLIEAINCNITSVHVKRNGQDDYIPAIPLQYIADELESLDQFKPTPITHFKITSVHRDDLEDRGFDTSNVSDQTMERLADKMSNAYLEGGGGFWLDLEILAEEVFEIPKKETS